MTHDYKRHSNITLFAALKRERGASCPLSTDAGYVRVSTYTSWFD